ncbi:amidohydrolase family protein [Candidatus Giovannonibacteria bacterium]|nr:amidohydrolase family protein [Candidatus Giovannonibacteria bacterium]
MASYSVIIKGGSVLRGNKLEPSDVGINKDKIEAVGDLSSASGDLIVDAKGKYVSPGFIDLTNHSDTHWTLFSQPRQDSLLIQGITTILGGNCGASLAPLVKSSDIEGIQKWADVREINTNWRTVGEFFEELSKHSIGVNFATLVGHGTLRRGLLGDNSRELDDSEIEQLRFLLEGSLKEGAFGISTSLGAAHAKNSSHKELSVLFNTVAKAGGITKHHLKDEGKNILPSLVEILSLGKESRTKIQISHFKLLGKQSWDYLPEALKLIEGARSEGVDATFDFFPYTRTGSPLYSLLPEWAIEGGRKKIISFLQDPEKRKSISDHIKSLTLHYESMIIASTLKDSTAIGKTVRQIATSSGLDPEEIIAELIEVNELNVSIFNEAISPEHLEVLAAKEYSFVSSDGVGYDNKMRMPFDLPHPRSFGAYTRALELFSKNKNLVGWGELLHKFSAKPAEFLGIKNRGKLETGFFADVVVLDPEKVSSPPDYTSLSHEAYGIDWVFVNGKVAVRNGVATEEFAGRIIKKA